MARSCSSSTTTSPTDGKGEKMAERAPTQRNTSPSRIFLHWEDRSAGVSPLWSTATPSRKRERTLPSNWGVRAISGTRKIACLPVARTCSTARR